MDINHIDFEMNYWTCRWCWIWKNRLVLLSSCNHLVNLYMVNCPVVVKAKNIHHMVIPEEAVWLKSEHWRWNQSTKVCNFVKVHLSCRPKQGNTPVFKGAFQPFWLSTSVQCSVTKPLWFAECPHKGEKLSWQISSVLLSLPASHLCFPSLNPWTLHHGLACTFCTNIYCLFSFSSENGSWVTSSETLCAMSIVQTVH